MEKVPMTAEGYRVLDDQLKQLKSVERPSVISAISEAREHGDLSENAEYHEARELQANIEDRIAKLESMLKNATIVSSESAHGEHVRIGSVATVEKSGDKAHKKFKIVGS